ncbi:hypothetical protein COOONC_17589, partial [Cooperia oncophora]
LIFQGLAFIHQSFLEYHGSLTSKCCLVDDRWQAKVSDYGLRKLRVYDKRLPQVLLSYALNWLRRLLHGIWITEMKTRQVCM